MHSYDYTYYMHILILIYCIDQYDIHMYSNNIPWSTHLYISVQVLKEKDQQHKQSEQAEGAMFRGAGCFDKATHPDFWSVQGHSGSATLGEHR